MSATDPLRDALERMADIVQQFLHEIDGRGGRDDYREMFVPELRDRVGDFRELALRDLGQSRRVLAAVPSEPNSTCVHDAEAKSEGEKLGAPAEPERASLSEALLDESPNYGSEHCVCGNVATPARDCPVHWALWVAERHRPAEPEAWEWRAVTYWKDDAVRVWRNGATRDEVEGFAGHQRATYPTCRTELQRRTTPGEWERFDG